MHCKAIALEEGQTGCEILYVLEAGCIAFGFLHELEAKVSRKPQNHKHLSLEAFPTLNLKGEHYIEIYSSSGTPLSEQNHIWALLTHTRMCHSAPSKQNWKLQVVPYTL